MIAYVFENYPENLPFQLSTTTFVSEKQFS